MTLDQLRSENREKILEIAKKHGTHNVRVFGSVARGESDPDSDIDLLVDMDEDKTLLDLGGLWVELQESLQCRVEVFTEDTLKARIRERALSEAIPL